MHAVKKLLLVALLGGCAHLGSTVPPIEQPSDPTQPRVHGKVGFPTFPASGGGSGLNQLTGDVTAGPGTGSQAAHIAAGAVTLADMANLADQRIVGNVSGGVAAPAALTAAQVQTMLSVQPSSAVVITGGTISGTTITLPAGSFADGPLNVTGATGVLNNPTLTGLTATATTLKNDLITGKAGGLTVTGGTANSENLTFASTTAGTVGQFRFGNQTRIADLTGYIKIGSSSNTMTAGVGIEMAAGIADGLDFSVADATTVFVGRTNGTSGSGLGLYTNNATSKISFFPGNTTLALKLESVANVIQVGFFAHATVVQQTVGANVNNVVASGTTGQFDDFTNLTTYATDAAAIHADISQLARSMAQVTVALRNYGLGN